MAQKVIEQMMTASEFVYRRSYNIFGLTNANSLKHIRASNSKYELSQVDVEEKESRGTRRTCYG